VVGTSFSFFHKSKLILSPDSPPHFLIFLLYSLGSYQIPQQILQCGISPQKRWDQNGNVYHITLHDAGINEHFANLFCSKTILEQAIEYCAQHHMLRQEEANI
jgi:hypothetical protein